MLELILFVLSCQDELLLDSPNREAVEAIVVARWIDSFRIEVQVVTVGLRVERRAPVVAARTSAAQARAVPVASGREENGVAIYKRGESSASHAVLVSAF